MDFNLEEMDFEFIKETRTIQFSKLIDLQLSKDEKVKEQVDDLKIFVKKLDAEIKRRKVEDKKKVAETKKVKTEGFAKDYTSHKIKTMSHVIVTEVPVFSSGHDVHVWLNKLESYYKLYVANDNSGVMEEHFIQTAKSRLCPEYLHSMLSTSDSIDKFEQMKSYMKKNHASKMSVFQILDTLWEMDQKESESFRDLGIRLDDKAAEAENIILAKFKEWTESKNENSQMNTNDIFKLVSGQVFLQILKSKHSVIYNNICNDLDKTWSAKEIALKAMTFSDRMASSEDSRNQTTVPDAFAVQQSVKNCQYFLTGKCKYGKKCHLLHDEELRDFLRNNQSESDKDDDDDDKSHIKLSRKQRREKAKEEAHSSYMAALEEDVRKETEDWTTPIVPLPTQNFRC